MIPIGELQSAYYLNLDVADRSGVLAQVAGVGSASNGVSIRSMEKQHGIAAEAELTFLIPTTCRRPTCRPPSSTSIGSMPWSQWERCSACVVRRDAQKI